MSLKKMVELLHEVSQVLWNQPKGKSYNFELDKRKTLSHDSDYSYLKLASQQADQVDNGNSFLESKPDTTGKQPKTERSCSKA